MRLELWQTEWCPASRAVRQRLTELGVAFTNRPVPIVRDARRELKAASGDTTIPALVAGGEVVIGAHEIIEFLNARIPEPQEAAAQREKAAKARRKELEEACPQLTAITPSAPQPSSHSGRQSVAFARS